MTESVRRLVIAAALIIGVGVFGAAAIALASGDPGRQIASRGVVAAEEALVEDLPEPVLGGAVTVTAPDRVPPPKDVIPPRIPPDPALAGEETTATTTVDDAPETTSVESTTPTAAPRQTSGPDPRLAGDFQGDVPGWVIFPGDAWVTASPQEAGLRPGQWEAYLDSVDPRVETESGLHRRYPDAWGVAITRGGYLVYTAGDPDTVFQSASVGKTFTRLALLIAEKQGLIDSVTDPVRRYWTGDGSEGESLSHPHKYLTEGYNADVTFLDLAFHQAGFPVSNGNAYSGDPFYDNYAKSPPGDRLYSSGGVWRLSQVLTYLFDDELKDVLDRELFQYMGIDPGDWDWITGGEVHDDRNFWPVFNGGSGNYYGAFVDPPYQVDGNDVQGGGGWVEMSPKDLARVGLLIATDGYWDGRQLISPLDSRGRRGVGNLRYLGNHSGFAGSRMEGSDDHYDASAWVRTQGITAPNWGRVVAGAARG